MDKPKHTPGEWVWGRWDIFNEDRDAQRRGDPYWTLCPDNPDTLTVGPFGRKEKYPDSILELGGYECDGIFAEEGDARLIAAAPDLLAACKEMTAHLACGGVYKDEVYADLLTMARTVIAKAEAP